MLLVDCKLRKANSKIRKSKEFKYPSEFGEKNDGTENSESDDDDDSISKESDASPYEAYRRK